MSNEQHRGKTKYTYDILIDIDALLDTRLGVLEMMDESYPIAVLEKGYHTRKCDDFSHAIGLEKQGEFEERFKHRSDQLNLLVKSLPTLVLSYITDIFSKLSNNVLYSLEREKNKIDINLYPYYLDDVNRNLLRQFIQSKVPTDCVVNLVNYNMETINTESIVTHYQEYIAYQWGRFLYNFSLKEQPAILFKLTVPTIAFDVDKIDKDDPNYTTEIGRFNIDEFDLKKYCQDFSTQLSGLLEIKFAPIAMYSPRMIVGSKHDNIEKSEK